MAKNQIFLDGVQDSVESNQKLKISAIRHHFYMIYSYLELDFYQTAEVLKTKTSLLESFDHLERCSRDLIKPLIQVETDSKSEGV